MNPSQPSITEAVLARYLTGNCTPAELREVERWLDESGANRGTLEEVRRLISARPAATPWDGDAMWSGIRRAMDAAERTGASKPAAALRANVPPPQPARRRFVRQWAFIATGAAAAAALLIAVQRARTTEPKIAESVASREYVTRRGQQATIQLTDGSKLTLAAASRLRIPGDFGGRSRDLFLDGEALIEVVHDTSRPFRVHTKYAVVEDIGTRFDVRAYAEDSIVTVAVVEGEVALAQPKNGSDSRATRVPEGVLLREGDVGTLGVDGRVATIHDPAIARQFLWTSGRLEFTDVRLEEVLRTIGRWYAVDLRAEPELSGRRVTASFSIRSVEQMINALSLAMDARVDGSIGDESGAGTIILRSKR